MSPGDLPSGTATFLFTDVEGSTRLLHELGGTGSARGRGRIHRSACRTGTPLVTDEGYVGSDVHRAARIAACGQGRAFALDVVERHDAGER